MKSEIDMPSKNLQRQIPNFVRCVQIYIFPPAHCYFLLDCLKKYWYYRYVFFFNKRLSSVFESESSVQDWLSWIFKYWIQIIFGSVITLFRGHLVEHVIHIVNGHFIQPGEFSRVFHDDVLITFNQWLRNIVSYYVLSVVRHTTSHLKVIIVNLLFKAEGERPLP